MSSLPNAKTSCFHPATRDVLDRLCVSDLDDSQLLPPRPDLLRSCLLRRRSALATVLKKACGGRAVLFRAGTPPSRNYPDNVYEFRASSHFLYFAGLPLCGAALLLDGEQSTLFVKRPTEADALWHGEAPSCDALQEATAVSAVRFLDELNAVFDKLEPIELPFPSGMLTQPDAKVSALLDGLISLRLTHDAHAEYELRRATMVTVRAHRAGLRATRLDRPVSAIRAAMEYEILARNFTNAYGSIVTTHGEILHTLDHSGVVKDRDLVLADVGAETELGWAADVTRTWPASGRFTPSQRTIYELVLAAQKRAISMVAPGVRYLDIHMATCRVLLDGLRDLGFFLGSLDGLLERGAHTLFFPHGVGHLLGLDVHDLEDLGDRAGYAPGRTRSQQFGLCYLRLDRDLEMGNVVTIEPGIYFVPAILNAERFTGPLGTDFRPEKMAPFADVRGIRIEDDVLVTAASHEVLTQQLCKTVPEIEGLMDRTLG